MGDFLRVAVGTLAILIGAVATPDQMHVAFRVSFALFGIGVIIMSVYDWAHARGHAAGN